MGCLSSREKKHVTPKVGKKEKEEEIENENASRGTASEVEPIPKAESSANADDEKGNVPTTKKNDDEGKSNKDETASEETDRLYKKYMKEVEDHAQLRKKYFDDASKAHDAGDAKLAAELRDKGKKETELMEQARSKASLAIYKNKNKGNEQNVMDLHGLQVQPALEIIENELKTSKQAGCKTATVIHGKGNHSDEEGPKIKGAVRDWLDEHEYKWVDESDGGAVLVTL